MRSIRESSPPQLTIWERFPQLAEIRKANKLPQHLVIIPDGNGRWAKKIKGAPIVGHRMGARVLQSIFRDLGELPIPFVTLWIFSADNWKRPEDEVNALMELAEQQITQSLPELMDRNVQIVHLGRKDRIPVTLRETIANAESQTSGNTGQTLSLAIDFGGEDQLRRIVEAARRLPPDVATTTELIRTLRDGGGRIPPADLIFRTSGELRTSDPGWLNGNQTELYVVRELLPDISTQHIVEGLVDFSHRKRRFGGRPTDSNPK